VDLQGGIFVDNATAVNTVHYGMGTQMAHRAFGSGASEAVKAAEAEALRLERLLSRFLPESDIGRINALAGVKAAEIHSETCNLLSHAIELSTLSQGLFDITIGPLVDLWDYKHASEPPAQDRIHKLLPLINYRDLSLDPSKRTAGLKCAGQSLDPGGIGKGYASDHFMEIFKEYGVLSAFSNIGGNVSTLGCKPDGTPWRVGIRHPRQDGLIGVVEVAGKAVVTSGDYERYFLDKRGKRFHHILHPLTGYPAESGLISATVVAESAMTADALSTVLFVAGFEKGLALLEKCPAAEAVLVDESLNISVTKGLRQCFQAASGISAGFL
jgi:thiamine biosynthesis lipoprotein